MKLSHADIKNNAVDLDKHVRDFLSSELRMTNPETDGRMYVTKLRDTNSVLITLSDHRFKKILFHAKKQLRETNFDVYKSLFVNDNLTSLHYSLFKKVKSEKNRRSELGLESFEAVYTLQGKVLVKKLRSRGYENSIQIPTNSALNQYVTSLQACPSTSESLPTAPPAAEVRSNGNIAGASPPTGATPNTGPSS